MRFSGYWSMPVVGLTPSVDKYFYCPLCRSRYTNKANMFKHLRHVCGRPPSHKCPHCDYLSRYSHNVYAHVRRVHPEEKPSSVKVGQEDRKSKDLWTSRVRGILFLYWKHSKIFHRYFVRAFLTILRFIRDCTHTIFTFFINCI